MAEEKANLENLRVVLVSTRNPLNIGAAARAMSNFGALHLRVVNPFDPSFREAKSAVGAAELLQHAEPFSSVAEAVADCSLVVGTTAARERELQQTLHRLDEAAPSLHGHLRTGKVAILFGSEKRGLSKEDLDHCHWLLHIPTRSEHLSMNLGQSVAVCLYELARKGVSRIGGRPEEQAKAEELERLGSVFLEALHASDYIKGGTARATDAKVRRMLRRLDLSSPDAELLLGMLRKIAWKLESKK